MSPTGHTEADCVRRKPFLSLLVIDLGDSCVVKVENGDNPLRQMRAAQFIKLFHDCLGSDHTTALIPQTFDQLKVALDGEKPVPRIGSVLICLLPVLFVLLGAGIALGHHVSRGTRPPLRSIFTETINVGEIGPVMVAPDVVIFDPTPRIQAEICIVSDRDAVRVIRREVCGKARDYIWQLYRPISLTDWNMISFSTRDDVEGASTQTDVTFEVEGRGSPGIRHLRLKSDEVLPQDGSGRKSRGCWVQQYYAKRADIGTVLNPVRRFGTRSRFIDGIKLLPHRQPLPFVNIGLNHNGDKDQNVDSRSNKKSQVVLIGAVETDGHNTQTQQQAASEDAQQKEWDPRFPLYLFFGGLFLFLAVLAITVWYGCDLWFGHKRVTRIAYNRAEMLNIILFLYAGAIALFIGGFSALMVPHHKRATLAQVCFAVATAMALGATIMTMSFVENNVIRFVGAFILCGLIGVVGLIAIRFAGKADAIEGPQDTQAPVVNTSQVFPVVLKLRTAISALPIEAKAPSVAILPLHPKRTGTFYTLRQPDEIRYPSVMLLSNVTKKSPRKSPIETIVRGELTNYSDKTLLSLVMFFKITFYSGDSSDTPILSQHLHEVTVPDIQPGGSFIFYVVNQSDHFAWVDLPKEATAQVIGEEMRRSIPFAEPAGIEDFLQSLPGFGFRPSHIKWDNNP